MARVLRALLPGAVVVLLTLPAAPVRATSSFDLIWRGTVGPTLLDPLGPGTLDIVLRADSAGVRAFSISIEFDSYGLDTVDVVSAAEIFNVNLPGMGNAFQPLDLGVTIADSQPGVGGLISHFDQATVLPLTNPGAVSTTVTVGSIVFATHTFAGTAAIDVVILDDGVDGVLDSNTVDISYSVSLGHALVVFPEPSSAALLVAGLLGCLALSRRRRA